MINELEKHKDRAQGSSGILGLGLLALHQDPKWLNMGLISLELGTEYFCSLIPAVVTHPTPQTQQHAVNFYSYFILVSLIKQIAFTDQKGYWGRGGKNVGLASLPRPEPFRGAAHSRKSTLLPGFGTETDRLLLAQLLNNWVGGYRVKGFPNSSVEKEPACNSGDVGLLPGSGRSPGEGSGSSIIARKIP